GEGLLAAQGIVSRLDGGSLACPCHEVRASHEEGDDGERPRATDPAPSRSRLRGITLAQDPSRRARDVVILEGPALECSALDELDLLLAPASRHDPQASRPRRAARESRLPAPAGTLRSRTAPTRRSRARRSTAARPCAPRSPAALVRRSSPRRARRRRRCRARRRGSARPSTAPRPRRRRRSEEHTSELQSRENLVCRLLLEKK